MYAYADYSCGQYSLRWPTETEPPNFGEDPGWISIDRPVYDAWVAYSKQGAVYDALFGALVNARYAELEQGKL